MRRKEREQEKLNSLEPIYNMIRLVNDKVRMNGLWNKQDEWNVKGKWSSRAYFLQDLKKFVPADIEIYMSQRGGTFAKARES